MKKVFIYLSLAILNLSHGFCVSSAVEVGEELDLSLNSQDVPIFYTNNPLTGLQAFTIITSFPLKNADIQKKIGQSIEKALGEVGEVIHLKDNDMRGFGAGNILLIQVGSVTAWDGGEMPISRVSLSIESSITLDKTGMKTFPIIWSINAFLNKNGDLSSSGNLTKAIQKLIGDFAQSYQMANRDQTKKPLFYIYN